MENQSVSFHELGNLLLTKEMMLTTAESCTGGLLGHMITNNPGSSDYFLGGMVTYSNEAKQALLGVRAATLKQNGAVSRETVLEMAAGVRQVFSKFSSKQIISISTSGIAGPSGGSPQKPVGTVWIGLSSADRESAQVYHFQGSREEVKLQSAIQAIRILLAYLRK